MFTAECARKLTRLLLHGIDVQGILAVILEGRCHNRRQICPRMSGHHAKGYYAKRTMPMVKETDMVWLVGQSASHASYNYKPRQ